MKQSTASGGTVPATLMRRAAASPAPRTMRALLPLIAVLGVTLVANAIALFVVRLQSTQLQSLVEQTQALGIGLRELHMHYLQAVSSLRLYVNSRNPLQVADYEEGLRALADAVVRCRDAARSEPDAAQRAGIQALLTALEGRMVQLQRARMTFDTQGMAQLVQLTRSLDSDQADRGVKQQFATVIARKTALIAQREQARRRADLQFHGVLALFVLVSLLLSALLFVRGQRERQRRRGADRALRESAQALQRRTEELERVNQELDGFGYSISHDLRAPVRTIEGYAAVLEQELPQDCPASARDCVQKIREGSRRMSELISDLLAFSKLGSEQLKTRPVRCEALVREVWTQVRQTWSHCATQLVLGPLPDAVGDVRLLRQVWTNLLDNAVKYSSRGATPIVTVSGRVEGDQVHYTVQDNGVGFDMQQSARLFGVFQRLHSDTDFGGTGAGLALSRRIVERHGGRMWATAAVGAGARFSFSLPGAPAADTA